MQALFLSVSAAAVVLFTYLALWAFRQVRHAETKRFCQLMGFLGAVSVFHAVFGLFMAGFAVAETSLAPEWIDHRFAGSLGVLLLAGSLALGVVGMRVVGRIAVPIRRAERMVDALTSRFTDICVGDLDLTPREWEVLEAIREGLLSDQALTSDSSCHRRRPRPTCATFSARRAYPTAGI